MDKAMALINYKNILYTLSLILSIYLVITSSDVENAYVSSRLLANTSVFFLYISLLPSALSANIKMFPGKMFLVKYRKSHGITAFLLGAGHSAVALFYLVGGLPGLEASSTDYKLILISGIISFDILTIMFITSSIYVMKKMGIWWKRLHRFVYLAAFLIVTHAVFMRVYFQSIFDAISIISIIFYAVLLVLQLRRFYKYTTRKKPVIVKSTVQTEKA